ncbi:MAG: 3-oxoacyl-[acyl-carrier-protein] reductase [Negativicutes bacterium]|nr:3-oxoacyl-[acyl-carrier-protein] reductase [Negativicutes bacterium]
MLLANRVALVTGASRGIGRAIAVAMAKQGARVVVNYSQNLTAARETVEEIAAAGGEGVEVRADVSQAREADTLVGEAVRQFGRLDILVNNAGITRDGLLLRLKDQEWQEVLTTNLTGAFNCTRAAARFMVRQRSGRIINVTSVIGLIGNPGQANYAAAKAGLIGLTKATARELAGRAVTVNAIAPGFIETDMTRGLGGSSRQNFIEKIPLSRLGQVEDVAGLAVFLASEWAGYITGQVINVDGGMAM